MLSSPIEFLISAIGTNIITNVFLFVIVGVFIFASIRKYQNNADPFVQYAPVLLISIGVLGTFMGIVAGLLEFDVNNIDTSMPTLLDGLKTAFVTSLVGMLASILFRVLVISGAFDKKHEVEPVIITINDLYDVMTDQVEILKKLTTHFCDGEFSMMGQFKLMRSEHSDNQRRSEKYFAHSAHTLTVIQKTLSEQQQSLLRTEEYLEYSVLSLKAIQQAVTVQQMNFKTFEDQLWSKLEQFAEMMSRSATEQVINALNTVIRDFNDNMTTQFGENFKKLNEAVFALLDWQENYKQILAGMKVQYEQSVQALGQTEVSVAEISDRVRTIPVAMDALGRIMEVNQQQVDELARHLSAFADIRDRAVAAVPGIQTQIDGTLASVRLINDEMTKGIQNSAEQLRNAIMESADDYREAVEQSRVALGDVADVTTSTSVEIREKLIAGAQQINDQMARGVQDMSEGVRASTEQLKIAVMESAENYRDAIEHNRQLLGEVASATASATSDLREQLTAVLGGINNHMRELQGELQAGGMALNQSYILAGEQLVKNLEENSRIINGGYLKAGEEFIADMQQSGESLNSAHKELIASYVTDTEVMNQQFRQGLIQMQGMLADTMQEQALAYREQADHIFAGLESSINQVLSHASTALEQQIGRIDQNMGREAESIMQAMGSSLAAISTQFTKDYSQLVGQMQAQVQAQVQAQGQIQTSIGKAEQA